MSLCPFESVLKNKFLHVELLGLKYVYFNFGSYCEFTLE